MVSGQMTPSITNWVCGANVPTGRSLQWDVMRYALFDCEFVELFYLLYFCTDNMNHFSTERQIVPQSLSSLTSLFIFLPLFMEKILTRIEYNQIFIRYGITTTPISSYYGLRRAQGPVKNARMSMW